MAVPNLNGEMGIITLNRAQNEGIFPIGLINQAKKVDGQIKDPEQFFDHDLVHTLRQRQGQKEQHKKIETLMENLPIDKRKRAELVYFTVTHETSVGSSFLSSGKTREEVADFLTQQFHYRLRGEVFSKKMAGLGKKFSEMSYSNKTEYIREHVIEDFMRTIYDPSLKP